MPVFLIVGAVVTVVVFYLLTETIVRQVRARREEEGPTAAKDPKRLIKGLETEVATLKKDLQQIRMENTRLSERLKNLETIVSSVEWDELHNKP